MRWLLALLLGLLLVLQYRLWIAEGSLAEEHRLEAQVREQTAINKALRERNAVLEREVLALQSGNASVEQRAREQLGLIREGEVFYQFVEKGGQAGPQASRVESRVDSRAESQVESRVESQVESQVENRDTAPSRAAGGVATPPPEPGN